MLHAGTGRNHHYLDPSNGQILDASQCTEQYPTLDQVSDRDNVTKVGRAWQISELTKLLVLLVVVVTMTSFCGGIGFVGFESRSTQ